MNLNYRIVWVDDTQGWVQSVEPYITEHLKENGYEPKIDFFENGADLENKCAETDLDLLIIDYHLPGENGDELISKVRRSGSFTEIVFYSQSWPSVKDFSAMDGVFRCERDDAVDRIKSVIDLTLHKLKDLGVIRGLIVTEAIDLEIKIEEMIVLMFEEKGEYFRTRVLDEVWCDFGKKSGFLNGILKDMIKRCDEDSRKEELKKIKEVFNEFDKEVIDHRNILAHSRKTEKDGKIVLEGVNSRTKNIQFDRNWLDSMRANLKKHKANLSELEKLLLPNL